MEGKLKLGLQVLFLVALIWFLGAMAGKLPGATVRIGSRKGNRCPRRERGRDPNSWVASGMGAELITSAGSDRTPAGFRMTPY